MHAILTYLLPIKSNCIRAWRPKISLCRASLRLWTGEPTNTMNWGSSDAPVCEILKRYAGGLHQVGRHAQILTTPWIWETWEDKQELSSLIHIHAADQTHFQLTEPTTNSQNTHRRCAQRHIGEEEKREETEEENWQIPEQGSPEWIEKAAMLPFWRIFLRGICREPTPSGEPQKFIPQFLISSLVPEPGKYGSSVFEYTYMREDHTHFQLTKSITPSGHYHCICGQKHVGEKEEEGEKGVGKRGDEDEDWLTLLADRFAWTPAGARPPPWLTHRTRWIACSWCPDRSPPRTRPSFPSPNKNKNLCCDTPERERDGEITSSPSISPFSLSESSLSSTAMRATQGPKSERNTATENWREFAVYRRQSQGPFFATITTALSCSYTCTSLRPASSNTPPPSLCVFVLYL